MARSSMPNMLDYNKQANEIMKGQVDLMGKKADLIGKEPTGFEAEQELFKNIKAGVEGKRKPAYQTIIEGLMNGVQYGMQKKQVEAQKEKYGKISRFLDYFDKTATELSRQNNENMQRENERVKIEPYAKTALELAYNGGDYASTDQAMQNIFRELKATNPQIKGDLVGYIPNTPVLNIRDAEGNIKPLNLTQFVNEETLKRVQDNFQSQQANNARMKSADASMMRAEVDATYAETNAEARKTNSDYQNFLMDPKKFAERESIKVRAAENSKKIGEIQDNLQNSDVIISDLTRLRDLIKNSWSSGKGLTGGMLIRGLGSIAGQTEDVDEAKMLLQSSLYELKNIFKGATSDKDISEFMATLPTLEKNPKSSLNRLNVLLTRFENKRNLYKKQVEDYSKDVTANLHSDTQNLNEKKETPPDKNAGAEQGNDMGNISYTKMQKPDGTVVAVPTSKVYEKMQLDYKLIK